MSSLMWVTISRRQPSAARWMASVAQSRWKRILLLEGVGLADEEIGAPRGLDEDVGPLGVAGVDERAAAGLQAQRERRRAARVHDRVRGSRARPPSRSLSRSPLDERRLESSLAPPWRPGTAPRSRRPPWPRRQPVPPPPADAHRGGTGRRAGRTARHRSDRRAGVRSGSRRWWPDRRRLGAAPPGRWRRSPAASGGRRSRRACRSASGRRCRTRHPSPGR